MMNALERPSCPLIILTGGPGAGKTAVLEFARKIFNDKIAILPESASIIFGGGFWRLDSPNAKAAAQRAIFHVQRELEGLVLGEGKWDAAICDRGTLDGLAYWPSDEASFWKMTGTTQAEELARYHAVIHLRCPAADGGYNHQNPLRIETAAQARQIDERIATVWSSHPRYFSVDSTAEFVAKVEKTIELIAANLPGC